MTARSPRQTDELEPARAIRRALAARGLKARDVGLIAVWVSGPLARERAELAVSMGLGRFTTGVVTVYDEPDPFDYCSTAVANGAADVAVALTIDPTGIVAHAFSAGDRTDG